MKGGVLIRHRLVSHLKLSEASAVLELQIVNKLQDFRTARKPVNDQATAGGVVVRQMLKVAAECHLLGLVHRDMKPEYMGCWRSLDHLPIACKDSVAILFMFDLTSRCTLNSAVEWYSQARKWNKGFSRKPS
ncbi:hypothetical protein Tsubulata_010988 [Turnera subulata]|uniref:Uncharacterized protein n=1 Tax=Turnera subulata TaxID=218843 RepID=A0A9Q0G3G7_9ROSI|nr:hypothetical protein Tsubulata_010988 [Turnera subulata]